MSRRLLGLGAAAGVGAVVLAPKHAAATTLSTSMPTAASMAVLAYAGSPAPGDSVYLQSYFPESAYSQLAKERGNTGNGIFTWRSMFPRSGHDGGTVISPTVPNAGAPGNLADYLAGAGETSPSGLGCWVRDDPGPVDPTWFGARMDAAVDNAVAFAGAVEAAVATGRLALRIPPGELQYSVSPEFGRSRLVVAGAGRAVTTLKFTGAGRAFSIDASVFGAGFSYGFELKDLTIQGNSATQAIVYTDQAARLHLANVSLREANPTTGVALDLHASILGRYEQISCSINEGAMTNRPAKIIVLGRAVARSEHMQCSTNTFVDCQVEGATQIGIHLVASDQAVFVGGTSEANLGGQGIVVEPVCRYNTFIGVACESNAGGDIIDGGISSRYDNCYSATSVVLTASSRHASVEGGLFRRIQIDTGAKYASITRLTYGYFSGTVVPGVFNSGTCTTLFGLIDSRITDAGDPSPWKGRYVTNLTAPQTVTPTGSPFTIANTAGSTMHTTIAGGAVTGVSIVRDSTSTVVGGGSTGLPSVGTFPVSAGDSLVITYTAAPSVLTYVNAS